MGARADAAGQSSGDSNYWYDEVERFSFSASLFDIMVRTVVLRLRGRWLMPPACGRYCRLHVRCSC
jgi:hypothetical protein